MSKQKLTLLLIILFSASCAQRNINTTKVPTEITIETPIPSKRSSHPSLTPTNSLPTYSVKITPSDTTNTHLINLEKALPRVLKKCPPQREVPLTELGLEPDSRLLVMSFDEVPGEPMKYGVSMISGDDLNPQLIPNTTSTDGWLYGNFSINPNGQWLLFMRWHEGDQQRHVWVSSLDGKQQWEVVTINDREWIYWVSEIELVVLGIPEERAGSFVTMDEYPLYSVNPFSGEKRTLLPLPDSAIFNGYFTLGGKPYTLYYEGLQPFEKIILYDYSNDLSTPIAQWLVGKEWINFHNAGVGVNEEGVFDIRVYQPYGFDLAVNLDLENISLPNSYEEVMVAVVLPGVFLNNVVWRIGKDSFAIEQTYYENGENPTCFYVLEYNKMNLKDYCLDVEDPSNPVHISLDGRFVSFSLLEGLGSSNPLHAKEVVILDLETGRISRINGFKVLGWAKAETE
jgi:hypothetical protein